MKVLLIFPPKITQAIEPIKLHKGLDEESGAYPPLGLLYIASYINKFTSHTAEIIDAPAERLTYEELEKKVSERKPDVCGIYFCTEYLSDALKTTELVKKCGKKIVTVAGGPHLFLFPNETERNSYIDYSIYGEGEITFAKLLEALSSNQAPDLIEGVIAKTNLGKAPVLQKIENLDELPFPDRRLLNPANYKSFITYSNPVTTMMTSRGCAYNCYFCNNIERGQKVRMRTPENVVAEIEEIVRLGIRDILFFDENFASDIKRVEKICALLLKRKIKVRWHARSRADMKFNPQVLALMKKSGCRMIQLGIETGSPRLQEFINKNLNLEDVKKTIGFIKKAGILVYGNFILGLPGETVGEMNSTIDYALNNKFDYAPFSIFNPLPKSVFYNKGIEGGIIKKDYWLEYIKNPQKRITDCWWPEHNFEMLHQINYNAFRKFYFRFTHLFKILFIKQDIRQKLWQLKSGIKLFVLPIFNKALR